MLEPVNTVLKAVKRLNLLPGDKGMVAGQGPIGLMFTRILQLQGMRVLAADLLDSRLKLAKKFGAKWILNVSGSQREEAQAKKSGARQRLGTSSPSVKDLDAAIIAVPSDAAVTQAFQLIRGAGQILLFAHTKRSTPAEGQGGGRSTFSHPLSTIDF